MTIKTAQARVLHADCLDAMRDMEADSIDAIVTDPPYGLAFMGKGWDHGVPGVEFWRETLRVAKPGAHLVAFGGTRTFHRLACAIEDAGWEVRDCLSWLYGSGFPKSLDVSKALDKLDATDEQERRRFKFTKWVRSTGATAREIDEATGTMMGGHYTSSASQPAIMTREHLDACRHLLGDVPEWVERECEIRSVESANFASRKVVGEFRSSLGGTVAAGLRDAEYIAEHRGKVVPLTVPATDAAKQWQGWGTALKPAWEPAILARKPLVGTVAANVLAHGTGAINVDACRVGNEVLPEMRAGQARLGTFVRSEMITPERAGRWPANVALDEEAAAMLDAQTGVSPPKPHRIGRMGGSRDGLGMGRGGDSVGAWPADPGGGASRFFYTAKASRKERGEGNTHPTVKPLSLMRWLVKLVTPPGGVVLDPFCGSGSTLVAAVEEGFDCIGIEREAEYVEIIKKRIS